MPLFVEGIHRSISLESYLKFKHLVSPLLEVTQSMAGGIRNMVRTWKKRGKNGSRIKMVQAGNSLRGNVSHFFPKHIHTSFPRKQEGHIGKLPTRWCNRIGRMLTEGQYNTELNAIICFPDTI